MMLTIRDAQLALLGGYGTQRFVDAMCRHVLCHFPGLCAGVPEAQLKHSVEASLARGREYGFTSPRDACRYLNLSAAYGWELHAGLEHEWMLDYLADSSAGPPSSRLDRLVQEVRYRDSTAARNAALWPGDR
jgi:hypothetical protein